MVRKVFGMWYLRVALTLCPIETKNRIPGTKYLVLPFPCHALLASYLFSVVSDILGMGRRCRSLSAGAGGAARIEAVFGGRSAAGYRTEDRVAGYGGRSAKCRGAVEWHRG